MSSEGKEEKAYDELGFEINVDKGSLPGDELRLEQIREDRLTRQTKEWKQHMLKREEKWDKKYDGGSKEVHHSEKVKRWIRKGIPMKHRPMMWMKITGADEIMELNGGTYQHHVRERNEEAQIYIDKDIFRTFPTNKDFQITPEAQQRMEDKLPMLESILPPKVAAVRRILRALANAMPSVGYCQGMNFIVGSVLLVLNDEEKTFWLVQTLYLRLVPKYHSRDMHMMRIDQMTLESIIKKKHHTLVSHIEKHGFNIRVVTTRVFACFFYGTVDMHTLYRIWDVLFNEGSKILFRVYLSFIEINKNKLMKLEGGDLFKELTGVCLIDEDTLMDRAFKISLSRKDIDVSRQKLLAEYQQGKLIKSVHHSRMMSKEGDDGNNSETKNV